MGWTSTKLGLMCFAQGHNKVTPVRLEPVAPRYTVCLELHLYVTSQLIQSILHKFVQYGRDLRRIQGRDQSQLVRGGPD